MLNTDSRIHSLAQAVLCGDLKERGRENALRLFLNTSLAIEKNMKNPNYKKFEKAMVGCPED